jgi:hypothetical protein
MVIFAALRDDSPAVLDTARFSANGKNRTTLPSAQRLPGTTGVSFRWSGGTGCALVSTTPLTD